MSSVQNRENLLEMKKYRVLAQFIITGIYVGIIFTAYLMTNFEIAVLGGIAIILGTLTVKE